LTTATVVSTQRCPRCRQRRDTGQFSPSQVGITGRYCRPCLNEYRRRRRRAKKPPGYAATHLRVNRYRGPASRHVCWDCRQRQARDWSYDHTDELEVIGVWNGRKVAYSLDVMRYRALCRRCHSTLDARRRSLPPVSPEGTDGSPTVEPIVPDRGIQKVEQTSRRLGRLTTREAVRGPWRA
jgi:hypothetical protein